MDIDSTFRHHKPTERQMSLYGKIREEARDLAHYIDDLTPQSAEQTIALRKLQECVMFANAAIAINEERSDD